MSIPDYATVEVKRVATPEEATTLVGDTVPTRQANVPRNTLAIDADTGEPVAAYLDMRGMAELRHLLHSIHYGGLQRSRDYTSKSQTFGYAPRRPMRLRESCSTTSITLDRPDVQSALDTIADRCAEYMENILPGVVAADREQLADVLPEWKMGGKKLWTSGVVNHTAQLPYHRDNFNYPVWSAMPVIRRGTRGGHLHIPEYDMVIPCQDSTVSIFLGQGLVHGVTPIDKRDDDGYRFSVVYYALKGMKDCFTHAEETAYGQKKRTERQRDIAKRLAEGDTGIPGRDRKLTTADADSCAEAAEIATGGAK